MAFFLGANDQSLYLDRITFLYGYHPHSCENSIPRTSNLARGILPHAMYPPIRTTISQLVTHPLSLLKRERWSMRKHPFINQRRQTSLSEACKKLELRNHVLVERSGLWTLENGERGRRVPTTGRVSRARTKYNTCSSSRCR